MNNKIWTTEEVRNLVKSDSQFAFIRGTGSDWGQAKKFSQVKNASEDLCIEAIKINPLVINFVENQTEKICLEAVSRDSYLLKYVRNQTKNIIDKALELNGDNFTYIKDPTIDQMLDFLDSNSNLTTEDCECKQYSISPCNDCTIPSTTKKIVKLFREQQKLLNKQSNY